MALSVREGVEAAKTEEMPSNLTGNIIPKITHLILFAVGAISVIMLLFGGLRYALSAGDSKKVTDAKNTILYALIGLAICIFAYAIVEFVLGIVNS
ncbi:hypothetical protein IKF81_01180 [Candidatus Saccharibacteria bacterium]|nr:hypothetical protein [Candidatus Saccharibacteria bacterium]